MNKPFRLKWKWILLVASGLWLPIVALYEAGFVIWEDVTFAHTLIWPAMVVVALIPFSSAKLVNSKWLMPIAGVWAGTMFPGVYIGGNWIMGWVNHCGKLCAVGGMAIFLAFNMLGAIYEWSRIVAFGRRKLAHSIQAAAV